MGSLGKGTFCMLGSPTIQHQGPSCSSHPPLSQSRSGLSLPDPSGLRLPHALCTLSGQTWGRGPGTLFLLAGQVLAVGGWLKAPHTGTLAEVCELAGPPWAPSFLFYSTGKKLGIF